MEVDDKPLISVIVPVYNAEKYIKRCVDSILKQDFADFEVLLINDGSIDNSGILCKEFEKIDKRVRTYHKENGGVSSARNIGIKKARGEFSIQVDSDDFVAPDMLKCLYEKIINSKADIIICDYFVKNEKGLKKINQGNFKKNDEIISLLMTGALHGGMWNKLIRTSLFNKYTVWFPENISLREDLYVCISLFLNDIKVDYLNNAFYFYCQNSNSLSTQLGDKQINNHLSSAKEILSLLNNKPQYINEINTFKLKTRMNIFVLSDNGQEIKYLFPETNKHLFKNKKLPNWVKLGMISVIWGYGLTAYFLLNIRRKIG